MVKISRDDISGISKAFSFVGVGILFLVVVGLTYQTISDQTFGFVPIAAFIFFVIFTWVSISFSLSLADEVYDDGNKLLIKRPQEDQELLLRDIEFLEDNAFSRPPHIKIKLLYGGKFGSVVRFVPINSTSPFKFYSEIARDLSKRIEDAKYEKETLDYKIKAESYKNSLSVD